MKFYLFLDESGDHGMSKIDPNFPILLLCGVLISDSKYQLLKQQIEQLKYDLWQDERVILHSRDIRRKEGPFYLFTQKEKWIYFLSEFNRIVTESTFRVISAVIQKEAYKDRQVANPLIGVYGHAFTFLIERCVFCLDEVNRDFSPELRVIAESRGTDADLTIAKYLKTIKLSPRGTGFVPSHRINQYGFSLNFMAKSKNNVGLQIADLMAYPIARFVIDGYTTNPSFEILKPRIYNDGRGNFKGYGLKVFPE
ncbi:DUF3800 domain-containing protein [Spirosoma sp. KNUC1025]|uniref:DUF3800 domain-containing protein n=1 Tax=Spirosoma sp. KNUC1025 TaxID=2894082 RepID=UPI00386C5B41|nr:DUF3800 domain-containing protein [Spirosoma sp. KNUC1025]